MSPDRKRVIRISGIAVSLLGGAIMTTLVARFLLSVAHNGLAGGRELTRFPEYYRQIGVHYARGFTAGFFLCYFLMLFAVIAGSWVDECLKARRASRAVATSDPAGASGA
ncbi:MAG TPA: hypothetical protein VFT43_06385 [Candidatus Polarisedimenticolia bacterium]|nr:hypothetical protein [Candidatus Polarisedimenticolia bacterium]